MRTEPSHHVTGFVRSLANLLFFAMIAIKLFKMKIKADQKLGVKVVMRAIEEPLRRIAGNAGYEGSVVIDKVKRAEGAKGYNAETNEYEDLIKAGVIDPTKVVRYAIQNAASVSGLMLTTEAMIAEKPEKKKGPAMPPGGMDEDMY